MYAHNYLLWEIVLPLLDLPLQIKFEKQMAGAEPDVDAVIYGDVWPFIGSRPVPRETPGVGTIKILTAGLIK